MALPLTLSLALSAALVASSGLAVILPLARAGVGRGRGFRKTQHAVVVLVEPPQCLKAAVPFTSVDSVVAVQIQIRKPISAVLVDVAGEELAK